MKMTMYDESVRRTQARLDHELFLARGKHTGRLYYQKPNEYLATHLQLIGASNYGKSYYLEHLLRGYTALDIPASIIDPHGDHAEHYNQYLQRNPRLQRDGKIIYLKPGSPSNGVGFNPFQCGLREPGEVASLLLEAFMKVWGAESFNDAPRMERVLSIVFHVFAEHALSLPETYHFLQVENRALRENMLATVANEKVRHSWEEIERLPRADKLERLESSWNRLYRFLRVPALERLFALQDRTVNFTEIFNQGQRLVVNLSLLPSTECQSLVGTMLVNAMYHAARRRKEGRRKHWVLAIDEFPQFVTTDIGRSLDQLRKFGIRLILAHQHLSQLPPELLGSVMTNAKIKVVFGGLWRPDAEIIARELFTGEVRGDLIKRITYQTKFRPYITEREVETYSESTSDGESESDGWSSGSSHGGGQTQGDSSSQRLAQDLTDETLTHTFATSSSYLDSHGSSGVYSTSHARAQGRSWGTQFVTEHDEFKEETSRQYWPLEEQWEKLIARLMNLDRREAMIKVFNRPMIDITTPEITHEQSRRWRRWRRPPSSKNRGVGPKPLETPKGPDPNGGLPDDFHE
jgi:hypothetical protein